MSTISHRAYLEMFGPTVGDRVRLGDTALIAEVEKDLTIYGEEIKFGPGGVPRDGMGQSQRNASAVADTVLTNALIIDHRGIVKADIGIKNGHICNIGKAGNPDVQPGITIAVGAATEIIAAERFIVTAGGIDGLARFTSPRQIEEALASGITSMIGGGTGAAAGSLATGSTPGPWHLACMLQATDALPINLGLLGKGSISTDTPLMEQIEAGAMGFILHEAWGITPSAIEHCLSVADETDTLAALQADTLSESGSVETIAAASQGRTLHTLHKASHREHVPEFIKLAGLPNILPASSQSGDRSVRGAAAEDILHDMGALSLYTSEAPASCSSCDIIRRCWQSAHRMKTLLGPQPGDGPHNDNARIKRYIAKYTINPAIANGISHVVGSVETGKYADLVLWQPALFGVKPALIVKGGQIAAAGSGDALTSGRLAHPLMVQPMFAACGDGPRNALTFVSQTALALGALDQLGLIKPLVGVKNIRKITKSRMVLNAWQGHVEIDPDTGAVLIEGQPLAAPAVREAPLAQRYFLF